MSLRSWPVRLAETAATVVMVTAVVKAVVEVVVVVVRAVVGCTSLEVDAPGVQNRLPLGKIKRTAESQIDCI